MFNFLVSIALLASINPPEEMAARRIYDHLRVNDRISAVEEGKRAIALYPDSYSLQTAYIRALCEQGAETEAWEAWQKVVHSDQMAEQNRHLLEVIAWGVLNKGEVSSQLSIRLCALIGAAMTHDAKAIPLLVKEMQSSNAHLRSIAVKLSASYGDQPLRDEIARLVTEEKVWYVRMEAIRATGQLQMVQLKPQLKEIISNPKTLAEEKAAAIVSLVGMYDRIEEEELLHLIKSDRAGLRQLGCEVVGYLQLDSYLKQIEPLLNDSSPDVRMAALNLFGMMRSKALGNSPVHTVSLIQKRLTDSSPPVAITAAWAALLCEDKLGEKKMREWLFSENPEYRRMASSALSASGRYGIELAIEGLRESNDPYVRVNLGLGLIGQRREVKECCRAIYDAFFSEENTLWMWDHSFNPLFRSLAPSKVSHIDQIPHYPIVVDQMTRLELLSALSIVRFPQAQEAVRGFLQKQTWGVTGAAAATMLQEGDEEDLTAVRALLNDPDEKVQVQAALILALVGSDPSAVQVLQKAYFNADREMKVHILEALAHVGSHESIPFLLMILKEPFQILRVVAASALIQCLYH